MKRALVLLSATAFTACVDTGDGPIAQLDASVPEDASSADAAPGRDASARPDAGPRSDASAPDASTPPDLVPIDHAREMRAIWVATVSNIDFPRSSRLTPEEAQADLEEIVARTATAGLNAIFFQVRPESDALYASTLEPWSRFLTGTQGRDPGYDPLRSLIALAERRHVEVHAWINPYRGLSSSSATPAANHVTRTLSQHAIPYGSGVTMDPGAPAVRAHVVAVVRDLLERYPLDGIHFDDYFYPYPDANGTPFPDDDSFDAYVASGGTMNRADWRRDNVNTLVREVAEVVREVRPGARFGISPFGIYRNGVPAGIRGLDAYATIYCDGVKWMNEGWVDYLAPQLYWPTTQTAQAYGTLAAWWASTSTGGRHIFPGHALSRLGSTADWTAEEMKAQIEITRGLRDQGAQGDVFFSYRQMDQDLEGVFELFQRDLYRRPALPPQIPRALPVPEPPSLTARAGGMTIDHPARSGLARMALYREVAGTWQLERVLDRAATELNARPGTWAVSALGPGGVESLARTVTVR